MRGGENHSNLILKDCYKTGFVILFLPSYLESLDICYRGFLREGSFFKRSHLNFIMIEKQLLNTIFSQAKLTPEEKETVLKSFYLVNFKKNDFLFKEGQTLNHYYFLENGFVRSFIHDYEGNEVTTKFYSEPEIVLDWTSFMLRKPTQEYFQAITECKCWALKFEEFQKLFHSLEGFRESGRARFAMSYLELKNHHLSIISSTAKDRYLLLLKEHPEIIHSASLKHIATYLGVTDTSLSRIRKEIVS